MYVQRYVHVTPTTTEEINKMTSVVGI